MTTSKIKNIEFLRILFAIFIFMAHFFCSVCTETKIYNNLMHCFLPSSKLVYFFFIVSGFFFAYTFKNETFTEFVLKKIKRLSPLIVFTVLCMLVLAQYNVVDFSAYEGLFIITFMNSIGVSTTWGFTAWFTSCLFWGLLFYFGLKKIIKNEFNFNFITSIIVFITSTATYGMTLNGSNTVMLGGGGSPFRRDVP